MTDDGDSAQVYVVTTPVARCDHRCGECRRVILAGEQYERHRMIYDGFASTHLVCSHCAVIAAWLLRECGGTVTETLIEDIEEHAHDYQRSDLQSLASCARLQWRCIAEGAKFPGIPIPALPPPLQQSGDGGA